MKHKYKFEELTPNQKHHLANPFYQTVKEVVDSVATGQILKGAEKYPEPFNPDSWTNEQLIIHNLQELRDAQVYSVAMLDRMNKQERYIKHLESENTRLQLEKQELFMKTQTLGLLKADTEELLEKKIEENTKLEEEVKRLQDYHNIHDPRGPVGPKGGTIDEIIEREKGRTAHGFSF